MNSDKQQLSDKKLLGKVYTPDRIVEKILTDINFDGSKSDKKILDPACGDGQFLVGIVKTIIKNCPDNKKKEALENVYGWDIDDQAKELCIRRLDLLVEPLKLGKINWKIQTLDSINQLTFPYSPFDFIVGNPPYIRIQNLDIKTRSFLKLNYNFCKKGSTDIYIAFFELSIKLLAEDGKCAFITPNSYFISETAHLLRQYFEEHKSLIKITNFRDNMVFEDASTYSAITIFGKNSNRNFIYEESDENWQFRQIIIPYNNFIGRKFWFLSLNKKLLIHKKGKRLGDICQISVGIATLADWAYIVTIVSDSNNEIVIVKNKKGKLFKIEKSILRPIIKASKLKFSDEKINEFIIYPYNKSINGKSTIISELDLKSKYPKAYSYFLSIKNLLDQRDKGERNSVAWYAFGRTQSMDTSVGKKIIFSPMKKKPNFILSKNDDGLVYSGYYIKFDGDYEKLANKLNSKEMEEYLDTTGRYFRNGWRGITKKVLEEFIIEN